MRNRETIMRRLERIESEVSKLEFMVRRGTNIDGYFDSLNIIKELVNESKSFIQQEPFSPNEINRQ